MYSYLGITVYVLFWYFFFFFSRFYFSRAIYETGYVDDPELGKIYQIFNQRTNDLIRLEFFFDMILSLIFIHCIIVIIALLILIFNEKRKLKVELEKKIEQKAIEIAGTRQAPERQVTPPLIYCKSCGAENLDKSGAFCSKCGTPLN